MSTPQPSDAFFSSAEFLSVCAAFAKHLAGTQGTEGRVDFRQVDRLQSQLLLALEREFDNRCGYCRRRVGAMSSGSVDRFFPRSQFPDRVLDRENLILSCQACNSAKGEQFPTDVAGNPLLLNPRSDDLDAHLRLQEDGTVQAVTPQGAATISVLHLNRPGLVEERRRERLYELLADVRPELRAALLEDSSHSRFLASMESVRSLNAMVDVSSVNDKPLRRMLYANVIACIETYLSDTLIGAAKNNRRIMRKFVETFHGFKDRKLSLTEIFAIHDNIDGVAIEAMADVLYHNLPRVSGMYRDTLGVEFPGNIGPIIRAVEVRHDIVHRNGRDKDGIEHVVSSVDVENLAAQAAQFILHVQGQVSNIRRQ